MAYRLSIPSATAVLLLGALTAHAQAILVGESLMRQDDVEAATRRLLAA